MNERTNERFRGTTTKQPKPHTVRMAHDVPLPHTSGGGQIGTIVSKYVDRQSNVSTQHNQAKLAFHKSLIWTDLQVNEVHRVLEIEGEWVPFQ